MEKQASSQWVAVIPSIFDECLWRLFASTAKSSCIYPPAHSLWGQTQCLGKVPFWLSSSLGPREQEVVVHHCHLHHHRQSLRNRQVKGWNPQRKCPGHSWSPQAPWASHGLASGQGRNVETDIGTTTETLKPQPKHLVKITPKLLCIYNMSTTNAQISQVKKTYTNFN